MIEDFIFGGDNGGVSGRPFSAAVDIFGVTGELCTLIEIEGRFVEDMSTGCIGEIGCS